MRVAVFDVDHTITSHSTARRFVQCARKEGLFSLWDMISLPLMYLRYRRGTMRSPNLRGGVPQLENKPREQIERISRECYASRVDHDVYPEARALVGSHLEAGDHVCLASASFETLLRPLAESLGVHHVIGTRLAFEDGHATGDTIGSFCFGPEKHRRVMEYLFFLGVDPSACVFYSDSSYDMPLFEELGTAVAVNPDPILRRTARERGWDIRDFSS